MHSDARDRDNNFDLIRLFAALQVAAMHANYWLKLPIDHTLGQILSAANGVPIFFVTSGFLIAGSLLKSPDPSSYWKRRAARIYPAMIIMMIAVFAQLIVFGVYTGTLREVAHWTITTASGWFTLANLIVPAGDWSGPLPPPYGVLWTIAVELQFYLLLPLLIQRQRALIITMAASLALALAMVPFRGQASIPMYLLDTSAPSYAWMFLLGALVRLNWLSVRKIFERKALLWLAAYAAFWHVCGWAGWSPIPEYKYLTLTSMAALLLMFGSVFACAFTLPSLSKALAGVDISYGIYLWHMPVICTVIAWNLAPEWITTIGSTLCLATLSWFAVERPLIRFSRKRPTVVASASGLRS